ncbi:MAG TPA: hypothetical protein H9875_08605 [Candidatus Levilactobacillus faecigallinarum]|uniref:Uncharacterized protein n=1 Tax=Candidatus Levilactobacillus faecigallinarum TaxID=2838638 RepID=A0A9D1QTU2_9LACO|nr:hypothetical protein [Candidatus Levilactobacillus faecigallinarum]
MNELEANRSTYLQDFRRENPVSDLFGETSRHIGDEIVDLMKKEDLTHDVAYASLQYAYNKIKYESNFLKI